jgi:uncharacterized cysteine cluster protein YcgN (CxxCxxCC family)
VSREKKAFWKTKLFNELTPKEWDSLCDGCGICCLQKVEDKNTGEVKIVGLSCEFLDTESCRCLVYADRKLANPDCILLTPETVKRKKWLPDTCAYRRMAEGRALGHWHPLISKDPNSVHLSGISIRGKVLSGLYVHPKDIEESLKELNSDEST